LIDDWMGRVVTVKTKDAKFYEREELGIIVF
jgi:hypothetical protein